MVGNCPTKHDQVRDWQQEPDKLRGLRNKKKIHKLRKSHFDVGRQERQDYAHQKSNLQKCKKQRKNPRSEPAGFNWSPKNKFWQDQKEKCEQDQKHDQLCKINGQTKFPLYRSA